MNYIYKYIEEESLSIYERYLGRKFIYLDLKYWILLRDGQASNNPVEKQLVDKIDQLYNSGKCIFPISDVIYFEIMKQGDEVKRTKSVALVNKYSEGLTIVSAKHQVQIEFGCWVRRALKLDNLFEPNKLVWSKYTYINSAHFQPFKGKDDVDALNQGKEKYKDQNKTFDDMFLSELGGFLFEFEEIFEIELDSLYYLQTGRHPTLEEKHHFNSADYRALIYNSFKLV